MRKYLALSILAASLALGSRLSCQPASACRTKALSISKGEELGAGGGSVMVNYVLTNHGTSICTLSGYPTAVALDKSGNAVAGMQFRHSSAFVPGRVDLEDQRLTLIQLKPGAHAWFQIMENDGMGLEDLSLCHKAAQVRIKPPNNSKPFDQLFFFSTCTGSTDISFVMPGTP
jgi:hypothetical protein